MLSKCNLSIFLLRLATAVLQRLLCCVLRATTRRLGTEGMKGQKVT